MSFYKYLHVLNISWQFGLQYRASVILWRLRNLLSTVMSLSLWEVLYSQRETLFTYSQSEMITYIFVVSMLQSVIFASLLHGLAGSVYDGELSNILLRPIRLFYYYFTYDLADKAKNFILVMLEGAILFWIFKPALSLPDIGTTILFLFWVVLGILINFFITMLFGSMGFWTSNVWGPKFLFFMIVEFTAGKLFPLDILPQVLQNLLSLTPFPYLSYFQSQLFLGKVATNDLFFHTTVLCGWCLIFGQLAQKVWKAQLKDYEAVGR